MSLHYFLRLLLVCLTHSVVGCFPGLSLGDIAGNYPKIKMQALEVFKNADSSIQKPIKGTLQRNVEQFNSKYQWSRVNSSPYSQRRDGNAKNPSFRLTESKDPAYVMNYQNEILSSSRNNPVDLSSVKYNNGHNAKTSYAFQTVQQEHNPSHFTGSQWSSTDTNLGSRLVKKEGLVDGMHAGNVYRSEPFEYQHISQSEMHSGSQQPLRLNEPYLGEDISVQPAHAERISSNYMSRSSNANHNMRFKSDANAMFDQSNPNQKVMSRVMPIVEDFSLVEANQQEHKSSPQVFSAGTAGLSQISFGNMREASLSKVPTVSKLIPSVVKRPNSNRGHRILPLKKAVMFSSEPDQIEQSDSRRVTTPQANPQSSFEYGNTKPSTSSYTLKDIQLTSAQNGYQNVGQSYQDVEPIETFHTQKYDKVASGLSADIPSTTNGFLSYKRFLSDENNIRSQLSALSKPSMQGTYLTPKIQFPKNTVLFLERDKSIDLPHIINDSLMKSSQHRMDVNPSGQSITQQSFVKNYPVPSLVPGSTMKSVYNVSPSVSGTHKDSAVSTDQNHPYYISPKKPYAFKGFSFVPTSLQKSEVHFEQKPITNSLLNMQYVAPHPSTTQEPLISDQYEKMLFQFDDFKTSQEKILDPDLTDSFNSGLQLSFTQNESNTMYDVQGQALAKSGTETSNNGAAYLQKYLKKAYKELPIDEVQSETSERWTSALNNLSEMPTVGSSISRFVGSNAHFSTIKSSNNHENPKSEIIHPIHKTSPINKAVGNAVVHPIHMYKFKEPEGPSNPAKEILRDRNSAGVTQSDISDNGMRSIPTSSVVIGKLVEVTEEGKGSGENSYSQNSYSVPVTQSTSYRSADLKSHKVNSFSTIYRSAIKQFDQVNETNIDFNAVDASQSSSPTSSFVIGRLINTFDNVSTKTNPNASLTKTTLSSFKPVQLSDIAGSASFTNAKLHSAAITKKKVVDVTRVSNHSDSTVMAKIIDRSIVIPTLQTEDDVQSPVHLSVSEFLLTAATDMSTASQSSFTEEYSPPQTTPQLDHSKVDTDSFYEGTLMPDITTTLVSVTSDLDWLFLTV